MVVAGFEPATPSMSRKCATTAPYDRVFISLRWRRDLNPWFYSFAGCCFGPLSHSTVPQHLLRADDEIRTRDPNLGKVVLYH